MHPADQAFTQTHLAALFIGRPSAAFSHRLLHKAGHYLDFAWDMSAEVTTGLIYASAMDITQQVELQHNLLKAKEAAEQTAQVKAAFLANMSHEIRTPLNGVMGMLDLVLKQQVPESVRQQLGTAIQSGKNLLAIVNDVLDFSKINAGKLQLEQVNFDLTLLLQEVLGSFGYLAQQKKLRLILDTSALQHGWCLGDPHRIRQIINNLISNALKFTAAGEVRCMASSQSTEDGIRIILKVTDTGVGLSALQQETIFQPFTQADVSTTRRFGGTGLGLTICKELVELMRGDIQVKSELGKGAEFAVGILLQPGDAEPLEPLIALQQLAATLSGKRILLVEDNPVNREIAVSMLRQLDCHVDSAEHGAAALLLLKSAAEVVYDAIVMDCLMPELDGFSATRLIRQGEAGLVWQHIPILALTANAMAEDRQRCLAAGMNDYLSKPYTLEQLQQRLFALFSTPVAAALLHSDLPLNAQVAVPPVITEDEEPLPEHLWQPDIFQKNFKGLEDIRSEVMHVFRLQLPQAANEIEQAWLKAEEKCLTRLAHGLKSSAAQLGCMALSQAAKKLEDATKNLDGQDVAAVVSSLLQLIEQTQQALPITLDSLSKHRG